MHPWPAPQVWHDAPSWPHRAFESPGQQSLLASQQPSGQLRESQTHWPAAVQRRPAWTEQGPHVPPPPQPSGPHTRPSQFGAQQEFWVLHWFAGDRQQSPSQQKVHRAFGLGPVKTSS
jgi:hypothetical protein